MHVVAGTAPKEYHECTLNLNVKKCVECVSQIVIDASLR